MSELHDALARTIQELLPFSDDVDVETAEDEETPDAGVLMGWVVVAEWLGTDGERWLSQVSGDAGGKSLPKWQTRGYAQELLNW